MKYNFCTLFDRNYLYKGLALYDSLVKYCPDFKLWILCMDDIAYQLLKKMNLPNVELITSKEFEDPELLEIKNTRTIEEYCWTCTPSLPLYILKKNPSVEIIAYLDADLYLFSSPEPIYEELGNNSIAIIPHRFPKERKDMEEKAGIYNVSMLIFRNDQNSSRCLTWWRDKCIEWCFRESDDGRLGDQKYLDDWPQRFSGVHAVQNIAANVGPWNVNRYKISRVGDKIFVDDELMIFYHFHAVTLYADAKSRLHTFLYNISLHNKKIIYNPYVRELTKAMQKSKTIDPDFNYGLGPKVSPVKKIILSNDILLNIYTVLWRNQTSRKLLKRIRNLIYGKKSKKAAAEFKKFKELAGDHPRFSLENVRFLNEASGITDFDTHYIYHPAWAARILIQTRPAKHIDIASTLTFCSMLSAFIPVEFYDFRPARLTLSNLITGKADLTNLQFQDNSITSLSCMHSVEHVGLGRYGDPIDPDGDLKAIAELKRVLAPGGTLLFVVPVGKPKIAFNLHRIYSYQQIMRYFSDFQLKQFSLIPDNALEMGFIENATQAQSDAQTYGCGCFWFTKSL